jgi:hypothetical protein
MTIGLPAPKDLEAMHLVDGMSIADRHQSPVSA